MGTPLPLPKRGAEPPNFRRMFIAAKRLDGWSWYLQYALDALQKWSEKWLLNLNINKCQVVTFDKSYRYTIRDCNNQTIPLKRGIQVLDLGVCFDEKLSFKEHIHAKINKAYMMLGLIKCNFKYLTIPTFIQLYISMVRSHLDYCSSVWAPYRKGDIEALEKVKKKSNENSARTEKSSL